MIYIDNRQESSFDVDIAIIEHAANITLEYESTSNEDLTLVFIGDDEIKALNNKYLHNDSVTDVLAFPSAECDPETGQRYLGDVLISLPRASVQAEAAGHALEIELQLLVVHGVLHLLGFDHETAEKKESMWIVQSNILEQLGIDQSRVFR